MSQQQQIIREQAAQVEYLVFDEQAQPRIQSAAALAAAAASPVAVQQVQTPVQEFVQEQVQVIEQPELIQEAPVQYIEEQQYVQEAPVQYIEQAVAEPQTQYISEEVVIAPSVEAVQENYVIAESDCGQQENFVVAEPAPCATPVQVVAATPAPCEADIIAQAEAHFAKSSGPVSLADLPPLPPVNNSCWAPPPVAPGVNTCQKVQLPTEERVVETNDCDLQTVIRENNNYTTYNQNVLLTVNRNHHHKTQIVENQVDHKTVVTNKVVKVNDIHRQQVEVLPGAKRVQNDSRETVTVSPAKCFRAGLNGTPYPC